MQVAYVNIDLVKNGITEALCVAKKATKQFVEELKTGYSNQAVYIKTLYRYLTTTTQ